MNMENHNAYSRRKFLTTSALTVAAAEFIGLDLVHASKMDAPKVSPEENASKRVPFIMKQIEAGVLSIGYAESGPAEGVPIILLHGWPYDISSYGKVSELLSAKGYRVLIPYLRGHGTTRFLSINSKRNGQQSAFAVDIIAFMDALKIKSAVIGGYDWGARTANIIAALWPERCKALISVSGYLIGNQATGKKPLLPEAELSWWYLFYFATERGKAGYAANRKPFAKLIWKLASPKWNFDNETFESASVALDNPDHVEVVIHNYRWRIAAAEGEAKYDKYEQLLMKVPEIKVPTVTIEGDANGAPHPDPETYANKFTGKYLHINLAGGIGHNPPQESPEAFAAAVINGIEMLDK